LRKLATILLLICFTLNLVGVSLVYVLQSHQLKQQMVAYLRTTALHKTQLIEIDLSNTNTTSPITWEDETEFELNGEMYDVVKKDTVGNIQKIYCIADTKETALQDEMLQANANNNGKQQHTQTLKLFSFFYKDVEPLAAYAFSLPLQSHQGFYTSYIPTVFGSVVAPPPKFV
jgi:hypothetical protein